MSDDALSEITVGLDRISGGIELEEQFPEDDTAPPSAETHEDVHYVTGNPTILRHGVWGTVWTQDIGSDEVEDADPGSSLDRSVGVSAFLVNRGETLELVESGCIGVVDLRLIVDESAGLGDLLIRSTLSVLQISRGVGSIGFDRDTSSSVELFLHALDLSVEHVLLERDARVGRGRLIHSRNGS